MEYVSIGSMLFHFIGVIARLDWAMLRTSTVDNWISHSNPVKWGNRVGSLAAATQLSPACRVILTNSERLPDFILVMTLAR
jgi:hypothetical protein